MKDKKKSLFDELGGLPTLQKVHKIFYDKLYAHAWLKTFLTELNQMVIENRQTAFMAEKMGASIDYMGKQPKMAHRSMYITHELFDIRQQLLADSLQEFGLSQALSDRWLKIDNAFRGQIVNDSIESFYATSWAFEKRIIIPKPK